MFTFDKKLWKTDKLKWHAESIFLCIYLFIYFDLVMKLDASSILGKYSTTGGDSALCCFVFVTWSC